MGGIGMTVAEVQRWSAEAVREVFHAGRERAQAAFDASEGLGALQVFDSWGGDAAVAAKTAISLTRMDLDAHGHAAVAVAHAASTAADAIEALQAKLGKLIAEAQQHALRLNPSTSKVEFSDTVTDPTDALVFSLDLQSRLDGILREADTIDDTLANAIDMADGDAPIPAMPGPARQAETRMGNQIDAFTEVFDRRPYSAADWETAAELDPHSYDDKNAGTPAHIVVGRIKPVPGHGVVRASLFIPSATVKDPTVSGWPRFDDNAGDNRGFNPQAGPESARVAAEIDYENGLVVVRQNPSVNLRSGQVKAGTPTVKVAQRGNGAVYIDYAAADPFSPGGEALAKGIICVKGQIVVQPGAETARLGGVVTSFPALEVYHDRAAPGGMPATATTTVARMWPVNTSEWGPEFGLPWTRRVGDPRVLAKFVGPVGMLGVVPLAPVPTTVLGAPSQPPSVVQLK
jgi:hypothetical protein